MKRWITLILAGMLVAATGCHKQTETETETLPPETTEDPVATEEEDQADPYLAAAQAALAEMTLEEKVWQLFIVRPEALTETGEAVTQASQITKDYPVGGVMLSTGNLVDETQTKSLTEGLLAQASVPLFVAVDEEGGRVARVGNTLGIVVLEDMYTYREEGTETAYANALTLGSMLRDLDFNLDFAPVADVWTNPANTVIGTRAYSSDPNETAELVAAAVQGFADSGIACSVKHFPGHGDTQEDSHDGVAYLDRSLEDWWSCEALPFAAGIQAGADMVMVGHITMPAVDPEVPASLSPEVVTGLLREEMGFDGVVVTDGMEMGAIVDYYGADAAVLAIEAGCDLVLLPMDAEASAQAVLEQVPEERIDESVLRILTLKAQRGLLELPAKE